MLGKVVWRRESKWINIKTENQKCYLGKGNQLKTQGAGETMQKSSRLVQNDQAKTNELFVSL